MGAQSSELKARLWGASAAAILGLSLGLAAVISPAEADKVGVAAAVNPDAFSSLGGAPQSQLNIGKSIFFNERINTTGSGLVQVLLVDGSTFTVGPGSDLVIDKFVYDPKKGTGQIAASFSKGVMRFVGGKISKNDDGVSVKTPAGALAIRGAIAYLDFKSAKNFSILFVFGEYLKLQGQTIFEPGYGFFGQNGQLQSKPFSADDLKGILTALNKGGSGFNTAGNQGGKPGGNPGNSGSSLWQSNNTSADPSQLINSFTQSQIQQSIVDQIPPPCTEGCNPTEPVPTNVRILTTPGAYTAFGDIVITDPGNNGILGGGTSPNDTPGPLPSDDFLATFGSLDGHLTGTVGVAFLDFPWFGPNQNDNPEVGPCQFGICAIDAAYNNQGIISQVGGPTFTYDGVAVFKPGFFAYQLAGISSDEIPVEDHLLMFGGSSYSFAPPASGGTLYEFALFPDISQADAFGAFASAESSPITNDGAQGLISIAAGTGYVSPLLLLDTGTTDAGHGGVWLQTNFLVGSGENKGESFINIALGNWDAENGITGARRGGSTVAPDPNNQDSPSQTYSFSGDIASLAGPDSENNLSHFMGDPGSNPNIVIGFDSTNEPHNIGRDTPLNPGDTGVENQSGATYHIGIGTGTGTPGAQTLGTVPLQGFAAGFAQQPDGGSPDILGNLSAGDVTLNFNPTTNTMTASLHLGDGILQNPKYNLEFGGDGRSAFIDDDTFAAIETENGSSVSGKYVVPKQGFPFFEVKSFNDTSPEVQGFIVSADAIKANEVLFAGETVEVLVDEEPVQVQRRAFCQSCDFLKWGAWGARVDYDQNPNTTVTKDVQLGWWIAGDVVSKNDMPTANSASYSGDAIGNVASLQNDGAWLTYVATGEMDMTWNFNRRSGTLTISAFDDRDYVFGLGATRATPQQFNGALLSPNLLTGGWVGAANGAFVGANPGATPALNAPPNGVMGNFGVGNPSYQATGIFGGTVVPR